MPIGPFMFLSSEDEYEYWEESKIDINAWRANLQPKDHSPESESARIKPQA